ncbi:MAG: polyprenyl synthetase family protein [Streptosporangiales bacterium]|nr:polyprenyl synthetase family protein [Streptosporangiales bacterium]
MSTGFPVPDPALDQSLRSGLDAVEELLRTSVKSDYPFVSETAQHLLTAGGKRFRPLLVLLSAHFGDPRATGVVPAAVVVELTHLATLYHDDVMDEAELRRGAQSANARWDNTVAILTGDFLFARASDLLADLGPECVRIQARTFERLVHGQIRETIGPDDGADEVDHYLQVIGDKTASLIATAGRFGAMLGGADDTMVQRVAECCELIGLAFQLSDDLLDISGSSGEFGKTPGTDLREGVRTLPLLYALRSGDPADARLHELLESDLDADGAKLAEALELLRAHRAMQQAHDVLVDTADRARSALAPLPEGPARAVFESLCDYVVARTV